MSPTRSTTHSLVLLIGTVALGLGSRRYPAALPAFVSTYAGDVLWASMVFWLLTLVRPTGERGTLAAIAFAIAVAVETSQRYHVPWLDALRASRLGALVLGQGFLWSDIVCYAIGVTLAAVLDGILAARRRRAVTGAWPPRDRRG
jgi:hypothetical protein